MTQQSATQQSAPETRSSIKETLTSILIALVIAFTVRGFVLEAFVIPTGSMAPTLLGANMMARSKETGYEWTVGPITNGNNPPIVPPTLEAMDIMSNTRISQSRPQARAGDRIFVLKYLDGVYEPKRFDVVVFKNPTDPTQNYIKRLVGLPGQQLALVDGDVFYRVPTAGDAADANPWELGGWTCAVKPERAQRDMWQDIADTHYAPLGGYAAGKPNPWRAIGDEASWKTATNGEMSFGGTSATTLEWTLADRLTDRYTYNEYTENKMPALASYFPVSDLRMQLFVTPAQESFVASATLWARGNEFVVRCEGTNVQVRARTSNAGTNVGSAPVELGPWRELGSFTKSATKAGVPISLDVWFVDQTVQVYEGEKALGTPIVLGWSIDERLRYATASTAATAMQSPLDLANPANYERPKLQWSFEGGGFTINRLRLQRDIFYRPAVLNRHVQRRPGGALENVDFLGFSNSPQTTMKLTSTQYFVCGDNSPQSLDARAWGPPDPLVAAIDPTTNVVPKALMIGRAFFVYFPAWQKRYGIPIPDIGRMRWIW